MGRIERYLFTRRVVKALEKKTTTYIAVQRVADIVAARFMDEVVKYSEVRPEVAQDQEPKINPISPNR